MVLNGNGRFGVTQNGFKRQRNIWWNGKKKLSVTEGHYRLFARITVYGCRVYWGYILKKK